MTGKSMYRYLAPGLPGPWWPTAAEAIADAIRDGHAVSEDDGKSYRWLVSGAIQRRNAVLGEVALELRQPGRRGSWR